MLVVALVRHRVSLACISVCWEGRSLNDKLNYCALLRPDHKAHN